MHLERRLLHHSVGRYIGLHHLANTASQRSVTCIPHEIVKDLQTSSSADSSQLEADNVLPRTATSSTIRP